MAAAAVAVALVGLVVGEEVLVSGFWFKPLMCGLTVRRCTLAREVQALQEKAVRKEGPEGQVD